MQVGHHQANVDADSRAFELVRQVLGGRRGLHLDGASSKLFRIMLMSGDRATVLTPEGCMGFSLTPAMMSELLERASVAAVTKPMVIGLPAGEVPRAAYFREWRYQAKLVWIVPADDSVRVLVRDSPEPWRAPFAESIPADGPLALRELPEGRPKPEYRGFEMPLSCPNCRAESTRYRDLRPTLVCLSCGRSFELDASGGR